MKRYYMINRKFLVLSSQSVYSGLKSDGTFERFLATTFT